MISYRARWAGLAAASLHDQASGTLITRPSPRCAVIASSVTSTRSILAPPLAAVLIPRLQYPGPMVFNIRPDDVQLPARESVIQGQRDRLEPELAHHPLAADVHVPRLPAVEAVEKEPIRARDSGNARHAWI